MIMNFVWYVSIWGVWEAGEGWYYWFDVKCKYVCRMCANMFILYTYIFVRLCTQTVDWNIVEKSFRID